MTDEQRGRLRVITAVVVSDKMNKTFVAKVERLAKHSKYGKVIKRAVKYKVHDEENKAKVGDVVKIAPTRPISKDKRWRLMEVVK